MTEPSPLKPIEPIPSPIELRLAFRSDTTEAEFVDLVSSLRPAVGRLCVLHGYEYSRAGTITLTLLPPLIAGEMPGVIREGIRSFLDEPKETDDAE